MPCYLSDVCVNNILVLCLVYYSRGRSGNNKQFFFAKKASFFVLSQNQYSPMELSLIFASQWKKPHRSLSTISRVSYVLFTRQHKNRDSCVNIRNCLRIIGVILMFQSGELILFLNFQTKQQKVLEFQRKVILYSQNKTVFVFVLNCKQHKIYIHNELLNYHSTKYIHKYKNAHIFLFYNGV